MSRTPLAVVVALGVLAGSASAQPAPPTPPPPTDDDDRDGNANPGTLPTHDRPLMRALAYERRDVVEDLLTRPGEVRAASVVELAEDVGIPRPHAETIVEGAKRGAPLENLIDILRLGVPAGASLPASLNLATATSAQLEAAGLSKAQAKDFLTFRASAKRVHSHFREVRAIREAKAAGATATSEATRAFLRASPAEKVKMLARGLGLSAPEAELESRQPSRAERRARLMEGTAEGARDAFASYRRADGSIKWAEFARSQTFSGASGVAHFAFAMFLKELTLTLHSGDRKRLEEFVDGLMTTDFFVNYGLFAAGASAADVAYGRFVRRVTRKNFLSGVLRSNIVLAAGLAVPMVARGQFELDTYLVDVAALGLSATAVKAAVEGVSGVYRLVRGGRGLVSFGRWGTAVGWVYSAGEAAVVLLLSDQIAHRLDRFLDERALRKRVQDAGNLLESITRRLRSGEAVSPEELTRAVTEVEAAYDDARRLKARPLEERLAKFRGELDAAGRTAHIDDTSLSALRGALDRNPALRENVVRRYGSVEAYLADAERRRAAPVEERLRAESEAFDRDWGRLVDTTYVGAPDGDPAPADGSRLATYDAETDLLLRAMDGTNDPEARRLIALAIERVRRARTVDRAVYEAGRGGGPLTTEGAAPDTTGRSLDTDGITNTLRRAEGLPPAGAGDPPGAGATTAPAPFVPDDNGSFDDGLPGQLLPGFGRASLQDEGTPDAEAAPEVAPAPPVQAPRRDGRRPVRAPLGDEGTPDAAPAPRGGRTSRAPLEDEGTADTSVAPVESIAPAARQQLAPAGAR